jgi:hypothetical protein
LLNSTDPLPVHQYPLAHSIVAYLVGRKEGAFPQFVESLKRGQELPAALMEAYDGLTIAELEAQWRKASEGAAAAADGLTAQR